MKGAESEGSWGLKVQTWCTKGMVLLHSTVIQKREVYPKPPRPGTETGGQDALVKGPAAVPSPCPGRAPPAVPKKCCHRRKWF